MKRTETVLPIESIKLNPHNARKHSNKQIRKLAKSIETNGLGSAPLLDEGHVLIGGDARLKAFTMLGETEIPVTVLEGLTPVQKKALALAENRIGLDAGWDRERLLFELSEIEIGLNGTGINVSDATGFGAPEIDEIHLDFGAPTSDKADEISTEWVEANLVSSPGDLWQLDQSRLLCGDARGESDHRILLGDQLAAMACHDIPYNVKIAGVVGRGSTRHNEFAMASGEMSREEYSKFLKTTLINTKRFLRNGALAFVFIDWRHVDQVIEAGRETIGELINLICWVKSNPGMGSLYRSEHELICAFKAGSGQIVNNVELGRHGRARSNVWRYPGANQSAEGRLLLKGHPTPKPVALVADAIKDCTSRGDIVLDCFTGSGATIIAAEKVGRRAFGMEIDPRFVDISIRRWQSVTGKDAVHVASGRTFDECAELATRNTDIASDAKVTSRRLRGRQA